MKRAEYEALIQQRTEIKEKLERLGWEVRPILEGMGITHHGKVRVVKVEGDLANIEYLEPGCHSACCGGGSYGYVDLPAKWVFGETDWKAEHQKIQDDNAALLELQRQEAEQAESRAQEQRDREEFERLKAKFDPQSAGEAQ